jgi:ankyrin repeat protein
MKRGLELLRIFVAGAFLASLVAGCGSMQPGSGPLSLDPVRMVNAIATDDVGYVRRAVESKVVTVNQLIPAPAYMEGTPLITVAARAGALDVLHYLIKAGADVNARTPAVETPLMLAAFFGVGEDGAQSFARHDKAVRMLVSAGAAVENEPHHYTALAYAAYKGRDQTLRYLLERGASLNANVENGMTYVNTPLMMAAIMGQFDTAVMLLNAGADPRVRKNDGSTARDLAVKYQNGRLARVLACAERLAPGEKFSGKCS